VRASRYAIHTPWHLSVIILRRRSTYHGTARHLVHVIREYCRVIIATIDHGFTWLAKSDGVWLAEGSSGHKRGALRVEDLATGSTMMLAPERGESLPTVEAISSVLILHPERFANHTSF